MKMYEFKLNTAVDILIDMINETDNISGVTLATITTVQSKAAGAYASISPTITERTLGSYKVALTSGMVDTLGYGKLVFSASGCLDTHLYFKVVNALADDNNTLLTAIKLQTDLIPASPASKVFKKNTAVTAYPFSGRESTNHALQASLTFVVERSIDGGAWANCSNSPVDKLGGAYCIDLTAAEMNGTLVRFRATGSGADTVEWAIPTQV